MTKHLQREVQDVIIRDLSNDQPNTKLRGLQSLCREIEAGRRPAYPTAFDELVISLTFSSLPKTRRWAYYAARLLQLRQATGPLEYHLERETDPSCRMWAWNAFVALASKAQIHGMLSNARFNYSGTPLQLIPLPDDVTMPSSVPTISWKDVQEDLSAARWVPISYGYDDPLLSVEGMMPMDSALIRELQRHEDISVAEYAIWSFFNRRDGTSEDLAFGPESISGKAPGIRGWAYRLLLKDNPTEAKQEFTLQAIADELQLQDQAARLGLARALRSFYWGSVENLIISWLEREEDHSIRRALLEHMIFNSDDCPDYVSTVLEIYRKEDIGSDLQRAIDAIAIRATRGRTSKLRKAIDLEKHSWRTKGDIIMGNKIEIGSIGAINANVVNFGTMRDAAKDSIYQADHRHLVAPIREDLNKYIDLLEADQTIDQQKKLEALEAINDLAKAEPGQVEGVAQRAVKAIKQTASAAKGSAEIAEASQRIIEVLQSVF